MQDTGSCWDFHDATLSGSQKAAVIRAAAKQLQSCRLIVSIMRHRLEHHFAATQIHLLSHMHQVCVTKGGFDVQCGIAN